MIAVLSRPLNRVTVSSRVQDAEVSVATTAQREPRWCQRRVGICPPSFGQYPPILGGDHRRYRAVYTTKQWCSALLPTRAPWQPTADARHVRCIFVAEFPSEARLPWLAFRREAKLALDGVKDLLLINLSVVAIVIDMIAGGGRHLWRSSAYRVNFPGGIGLTSGDCAMTRKRLPSFRLVLACVCSAAPVLLGLAPAPLGDGGRHPEYIRSA